jgi:hypothetical protein
MKFMLGDFYSKVMRENIFKPTIGSDSPHQSSYVNDVTIVKLATSKTFVVKSMMFVHRNILKYTWTSPDWQTHNQIDHILIHRRLYSSILEVPSFRGVDSDTGHC